MNSELENKQKKAKNITLICYVCIVAAVVGCYFYFNTISSSIWAFLIGAMLSAIITKKPINEFHSEFRKNYAHKVYNTFLSNVKYQESTEIDDARVIEETRCFKDYEFFRSSDIVSGKYKDYKFEEAFLYFGITSQDGDGHTHTSSYFNGKWMTFELDKTFKGEIHLYQGGISKLGINSKDKDYPKIILDDKEFNKKYRVYSKNEKEALNILNNNFMNSIVELSNAINKPIVICIKDNKIHIGIDSNKNSFNYSIFKQIDEEKVMDLLSKDYKEITKFIDNLKNLNILK